MENATLKVPENIIEFNDLNFAVTSEPAVRILVIATVSAGKSTLINALIGYDFNKVKTTACTDQLCYIYNKRVEDGITYWRNGLYEYDQNVHSYHSDAYSWVGFHFNAPLGNENICLIDTPGVNNSLDTDHWMITTEAIKGGKYDAVLFISNSQYNGTSDERNILEFLCKHCEKPVVFALNQLDRFKSSVDSVKDMIADTIKELKSIGFKNPDVYPISALYAFFLRRENLLDEEDKEELEILRKRFSKDYYNLPQYIGCDTHSEIDRAGITCLEDKLFNICEEIYNNHGQEDVVTDVQQRNVEFKLINVEKDVYRDSRRGMIIKTSFVTYGLKGIKCNLGVYFYDSNGTPLTVNRANGANASTDEHIYVGLDLIPDYDSTTYTDIELYMFYDDFHLIKKRGKKYDLKFLLGLYDYEKNRYVGDAFSDYHEFTISY